MATDWARIWDVGSGWSTGNMGITSLLPGSTLVRTHFGIRWFGVTSNEQNMAALAEDFMAFGLVTISSATGSTPPNPLTAYSDANPPLERWLYWSTTAMRPTTWDSSQPGITTWSSDATVLVGDSKGQVKANVAAGQQLHVFLSWSPWTTAGWAARGEVKWSAWASALVHV